MLKWSLMMCLWALASSSPTVDWTLDELQKIAMEAFDESLQLTREESIQYSRTKKLHGTKSSIGFRFRQPSLSAMEKYSQAKGLLAASNSIASRLNLTRGEDLNDILKQIQMSPRTCLEDTIVCDSAAIYRSIDGTCNNLNHASWGATGQQFKRYIDPKYENGVVANSPRSLSVTGSALPNSRVISVALTATKPSVTSVRISNMVPTWGQHLDHDITKTVEAGVLDTDGVTILQIDCCETGFFQPVSTSSECLRIDVTADRFYNRKANIECLRFVRSMAATDGCSLPEYREQLTDITAFIDASNLYGSDTVTAAGLRQLTGGLMKINTKIEDVCSVTPAPPVTCPFAALLPEDPFEAGDSRRNENPYLTTLHTIWLRVHNAIASTLQTNHPEWTDEKLYQEARRIVIALYQNINYKEFLPAVLGTTVMNGDLNLDAVYTYDDENDPSIRNGFATAAYRFGHTLVKGSVFAGNGVFFPLVDFFDDSSLLFDATTSPSNFAKGIIQRNAELMDGFLVRDLVDLLFAPVPVGTAERHGLDLLAINIERGRDHGIPDYNTWRGFCGLDVFTDFDDMRASGDVPDAIVTILEGLYADVNDMDLYAVGISETNDESEANGILGPTFRCILEKQFHSFKFGDRYFFQNGASPHTFSATQIAAIRGISFAEILCFHTSNNNMRPNVFLDNDVAGNANMGCNAILNGNAENNPSLYLANLVALF